MSFHPCHVSPAPSNPAGQPPIATGMYMPYIEGPCMDWTVNNNLYHRFLKWHLKCENILECKLAALLECQKCKKVIAWSGSVDEWYNTMQAQVNLARYPLETAKILHRDIFWFFLRDEDFVSRPISDGSIDLDKFPVSRVCQLAKKLESSKATARHIKQVSGEPQVAQINLLHHQRTELPQHRYKKKSLTQNLDRVTVNCYMEMTHIKVRR